MKNNYFAYKKKQLKTLSNQLEKELNSTGNVLNDKANALILKIKQLLKELSGVFAKRELIRILGAIALFIGVGATQSVSAQTFAPAVKSPFGLTAKDTTASPVLVDLDGDGDLDLMLGEYYGELRYFENTGSASAPAFGPAQVNPFGFVLPATSSSTYVAFPTFADFDNDGDQDLLLGTAGYYNGEFLYYENTGTATNPQFAAAQTNPFGLSTRYIFNLPTAVDLDGDGDFDIMTTEYPGNAMYFKNTGTASSPQFAAPQTNPFGLTAAYTFGSYAFADFDNDGDLDILRGELYGDLVYFQNTGTTTAPAFGAPQNNPFGLSAGYYQAFPAAADMDGDGDVDLFVSDYDSELLYYKNTKFTIGLEEVQLVELDVYPNPTSEVLSINTPLNVKRFEVLGVNGTVILKGEMPSDGQINVAELSAGAYYLVLYTNSEKRSVLFDKL